MVFSAICPINAAIPIGPMPWFPSKFKDCTEHTPPLATPFNPKQADSFRLPGTKNRFSPKSTCRRLGTILKSWHKYLTLSSPINESRREIV